MRQVTCNIVKINVSDIKEESFVDISIEIEYVLNTFFLREIKYF